jgi:hypothetical protein
MGEADRGMEGVANILSLADMLNVGAPRRRSAAGCLLAAIALVALAAGCRTPEFFKQYEYDEDLYLSLDGSATVYVNASLPALVALRGVDLDTSPVARFDRDRIAALFESPGIHVVRVSSSRQRGRRFAHVRLEVSDVRKLPGNRMFSWATVRFEQKNGLFWFREDLGQSAGKAVGNVGWTGKELVGFRLHLPSKIAFHNAGEDNLLRGNILVWDQALTDRLKGEPLEMEARMEPTSILYHTLWLFIGSMGAAFGVFAVIIWWVVTRGRDRLADSPSDTLRR